MHVSSNLLVITVGSLLVSSARADFLVDTGPGTTPLSGVSLFHDIDDRYRQSLAARVWFDQPVRLSSVGAFGWFWGNIRASIHADSSGPAGSFPGDVLATSTLSGVGIDAGASEWITIDFRDVELPAGGYWVSFEAGTGSSGALETSPVSPLAEYAFRNNALPFDYSDYFWRKEFGLSFGFRVAGAVVPTPAGLVFLGAGILASCRRRP